MDVTETIRAAKESGAESLDLSNRDLTELPVGIGGFSGRSLDLSGNKLRSLPREVGRLENLEGLYLRDNPGLVLPAEVAGLKKLKYLDLAGNELASMPPEVAALTGLEDLDLSNNKLTTLPAGIGNLTSLLRLVLSQNQLTDLPPEITRLSSLMELDLKGNRFEKLPERVTRIPNLIWLGARDNPLVEPPKELVDQGINAIRGYFLESQKGTDTLYEAKLIIVGEAEAGKTTLAKKILDPNYQPVGGREKSTEGIKIDRWSFTYEDDKQFYVNIWDFGGQEIYLSTHRFFLTESSLYILVARQRSEDTDFNYWLGIVQLLGQNSKGVDSPLIILRNVVDGCIKEISENTLHGNFSCFQKTLTLDLLNESDKLPDVLKWVKFYISQLPHVGASLPKSWTAVRAALDQDSRDFIGYDEFQALCVRNDTDEPNIKVLIQYFHDIGVCLHYRDDPLLERIVILKPEWGTRAVYQILNSPLLVERRGQFDEDDVDRILTEPGHRKMRTEILRLMVNYNICYPVPGTRSYIAPQKLPEDGPAYAWDANDSRMLKYVFPDLMPRGMLWRFIVWNHAQIEDQRMVWRTGVVLKADDTRAEVTETYPREIAVRVSGLHKREMLTVVNYVFRKIFDEFKKLKVETQVPCICEPCRKRQADFEAAIEAGRPYDSALLPHFFDFNGLRNIVDAGEMSKIPCNKSGKAVDVRALIDEVFDDRITKGRAGEAFEGSLDGSGGIRINIGGHMGDKYEQGQGIQGKNVTVSGGTQNFTQAGHDVFQGVDYARLAEQILDVRQRLRSLPVSDENDRAVGMLVDAGQAAREKNGPKLLEILKSTGKVVLDVAQKAGADIVVRLAEHAMGVG
ncbi:MAG: COR domain-containing protein [Capsulimonadaceae bacterium]